LKKFNNKLFSPHERLKQSAVKPWAVKGQWFSLFTTMMGDGCGIFKIRKKKN
jgi:hypothetical protein